MEIVLILATILALAACVLFGMATRTQVFILVALTAMVGGAGSALWHWLYGVVYADTLIDHSFFKLQEVIDEARAWGPSVNNSVLLHLPQEVNDVL